MKVSKRIISFFLLSIFLFNTMGYFIAFKVMQYEIKSDIVSRINQGINTDEATVITFSKNNLSSIDWQVKQKELIYKGKRYDVINSKEDNTSVTYYCLNDKQEESLFSHLDDHISTHVSTDKPVKSNSAKSLKNNVIKIYFSNLADIEFPREEKAILFSSLNLIYTSEFITTSSPPPELV